MIDPGKLRHRIEIQRSAVTIDSLGGRVITWNRLRSPWTQIEPLSHANMTGIKEAVLAGSDKSQDVVRVTLHPCDVKPDDRFIWSGRVYEIKAARLNNELDTMTLFATFDGNDG